MRALRAAALIGLLMVTVGVVWRLAEGPAVARRPSPTGRAIAHHPRPSPVPAAEGALRSVWSGSPSPGGVNAGGCVPSPALVKYPGRDQAEVDIVCTTQITTGSIEQSSATLWRVRLSWRSGAWSVGTVAP